MYEKGLALLALARMLQRTRRGLSYREICEKLELPRRTIERMLQALQREVDGVERIQPTGAERTHLFRISPKTPPLLPLPELRSEELAALQSAARLLRRERVNEQAAHLENLYMRLLDALDPPRSASAEYNADDIANAGAFVLHPGPRETIKPEIVQMLHEAIWDYQEVRLRYRSRRSGKVHALIVQPYGFLHGRRRYLVARRPRQRVRPVRNFALANIERVQPRAGRIFERDENFDLQTYASESFGAYHAEPTEIVWRFGKAVAEDARRWLFHPTQRFEEQPDGKLIVRFQASGLTEMAWHLLTWGDAVEVLAPKELREELERWKKF